MRYYETSDIIAFIIFKYLSMNMQNDEMSGDKSMCGMGCHRHGAIRVLTTIIVLIFTFWCGFQFGEVRASLGSFHGGYGMMQDGWNNVNYGYGGVQRMMIPVNTAGSVSAPSATTNAK